MTPDIRGRGWRRVAEPATVRGAAPAERYADLDGVESAVAVGERATTGVSRRKDRI